jgi:hypothetical protein
MLLVVQSNDVNVLRLESVTEHYTFKKLVVPDWNNREAFGPQSEQGIKVGILRLKMILDALYASSRAYDRVLK